VSSESGSSRSERHGACPDDTDYLPSRTVAAEITVKLLSSVQAAPPRVVEAMTDPNQVAEWWGPEGFTCPEVTLDVRVGGAHLVGVYVEVRPPSRLAYTFRWEPPDPDDRETVARLALRERAGATEIELTQGPFATEARRELHEAGWTDTLARLARHLAPGLSGRAALRGSD
jgi:uncharacterized protein YndB with AHSA1/START domain